MPSVDDDPGTRPAGGLAPAATRIVLIGLMGAGKTAVGRRLARQLAVPFLDADEEIVRAAGLSVADFFARFGEPAFRDAERQTIARLLREPSMVLATGGGAFLDPATRRAIEAAGAVSVWLRADLDLLVERTAGRTHRPLLNTGDPRRTLARLMQERYPIYALADRVVDAADVPVDLTVERVLAAIADFTARRAAEPAP
jgi:shikimate kinase